MSIRQLGADTALLLRASALAVTPLSVVKELVDNSIDAKATVVKIQISRNSVGQIEVQDNGVGICSADFDALGRRAHTSKLRAFQDLPRVGGSSFGFRGEALAAVNSLAEVTITTRTATEKVGHRVGVEPKGGGVKKHDLVSSPVGTTVCVRNLFANIPVRRQMAMASAPKALADMKHLLHAYALARPHIKIFFAVLGEHGASWSYSPVGTPTVREAVLQILGNDLASQCTRLSLTEPAHSSDDTLVEELTEHKASRITVDAFLPRPDADVSTVCGKGIFISVDGRPLAPGRGTMKKAVSAFKARFKALHCHRATQSKFPNIFFQLDVQCPPGAYDINVSPAKDEVMFTDESRVLKVIDSLFEAAFASTGTEGTLEGADAGGSDELSLEDIQVLESVTAGNDMSLGHVMPTATANDISELDFASVIDAEDRPDCSDERGNASSNPNDGNANLDSAWPIDMSAPCDDDDVPQAAVRSVIDQLRIAASQKSQDRNTKAGSREEEQDSSPVYGVAGESPEWRAHSWADPVGSAESYICRDSRDLGTCPGLGTESQRVNRGSHFQSARSMPMIPISPSPDIIPNGAAMYTPPPRMLALPSAPVLQTPPQSDRRKPLQQNAMPRFKAPTMSAPHGRQPPDSRPRGQLRGNQRYEVSPSHEVAMPSYREHQVANQMSLDSFMTPMDSETLLSPAVQGHDSPGMSPLLVAATDASARDMPNSAALLPAGSLGVNDPRAMAEGAHSAIRAGTDDEMVNQCDPRKYLMKCRRSMSRDRRAGRVLRRMKSALLPLETIPVDQETHTFALSITTSHCELHRAVLASMHLDNYVSTGSSHLGLPDNLEEAADIQTRIQRAFGEWAQRTTGTWHDLKLNLLSQMKGKYNE